MLEMKVVPVKDIPITESIVATPTNNLVDLYNTFLQMENICKFETGIGLSAVQVGLPWTAFVIRFNDVYFRHFIDCEYEGIGKKQSSVEGCLSLRENDGDFKRFLVQRYPKVKVKGKELISKDTLEIREFEEEWDKLYANVFQHEIDHQKGILISDIGEPVNIW